MHIQGHYASDANRRVELDTDPRSTSLRSGAVTVIVGGGRGSIYRYSVGLPGVWIPLHGTLHLAGEERVVVLKSGEMLVSEADERLSARGRGATLWVLLVASRETWQTLMAGTLDIPLPEYGLVPAIVKIDSSLRRAALTLARRALTSGGDYVAKTMAASELALLLAEIQNGFNTPISRCPGRTLAQRRHVFLRLQRVLNHMQENCHLDLDIDNLARMANYSTCHFIRAFSAAYGRTPHTVLVEFRLARAWHLLRASDLAIAEVAVASGFDNRCAFSRLFKRRYGVTAGALRLRSGASPQAPSSSPAVSRHTNLLAKREVPRHVRVQSSATAQQPFA